MAYSSGDILTAGDMNSFTGAMTTYVPALVSITLGNGTKVGRFSQPTHGATPGKMIDFVTQVTFGSTTSIVPGVTVSLPVTAKLAHLVFSAVAWDDSAGISYALVGHTWTSTTLVNVRTWPTTAGNSLSSIGAAVPFTWTTNDVLTVSGRYEAA